MGGVCHVRAPPRVAASLLVALLAVALAPGVRSAADAVPAAAANRATWRTPRTLAPGTYTCFCCVHPSMRSAFRVVPRRAAA
jgi:hypothetical protein